MKIRAEECAEGVQMSFGRTQLLSAELTKVQSTSFLPALVYSSPWLASHCCGEHSALAVFAVIGTNESAGRKRKEIAHQWNGVRL